MLKKFKTPEELGITRKQFNNLLKLANYLKFKKNLKADFNMETYTSHETIEDTKDCGTVGCAVGHGPYAGISKRKEQDWNDYAKQSFGADNDFFNTKPDIFTWLFSSNWQHKDNTHKGASKRIFWFLMHGLPKNSLQQMNSKRTKLCYV